ncbi:hypothetical protein GH714_011387 [Hevea brasiliensis]|uniref:RNase H type-1 domain-containing protein n=1 Tax=Hevea brasiliensis TaxID=3981 RepID=A0A6A6K5P6_HEVBR|nr:hypothetical protein GH714_011387 [Hevea brasiliensis]
MMVWSLLNSSGTFWNFEAIVQFFNERDKGLITRIPLSRVSCPNVWRWSGEQKGRYSIRSAYKALTRSNIGEMEQSNELLSFWKKILGIENPSAGEESGDETLANLGTNARDVRWSKPQKGWVKCNVDESVRLSAGKLGAGWVIRDEAGTMLNTCQV